jgi:hypothetical protein
MEDFEYVFIDKSGHCFVDFANVKDDTEYHRFVAALLTASSKGEHTFTVGDMLCFRDELVEAGCVWGTDFYVRKQMVRETQEKGG